MENEEELIGRVIDSVPQKEPGEYCNARRSEEDPENDQNVFVGYCRQPAGKATSHVGSGRCWLHGGKSPKGRDSPHWEHGLFSDHLSERDREHLEALEAMENAEKLQSMINYEILRLRRAVAELEEDRENEERGTFWEAFERIVDEASSNGLESKDIREIANLFGSSEKTFGDRIERIRRLTKTFEEITAGQKVNIDADVSSEISGPGGDALEISWMESESGLEEDDGDE